MAIILKLIETKLVIIDTVFDDFIEENNGEQKWTTCAFIYNLYTKFARDHIKCIKEVVDLLQSSLGGTCYIVR
jgi:hypothetical protein